MITVKDKSRCNGCHACASACPKNCIKMKPDEDGFLYPVVDTEKCVECRLCEKICPIITPRPSTEDREIVAYAAINKTEEIRLKSSSGGIFTLIAELVIKKGGVVFGAAFDNNFKVVHKWVDTIDGLEELRGSKYVQSDIGDCYKCAEDFLKRGRLVLFTGTPCQIGGLYSYLKKDYKNLITQDLICHGVPSPRVWADYLKYREKKAASKTRRTFFRSKNCGWKTFSVLFEYANNTEYVAKLSDDLMMKAFLRNLCLRPSCYDCRFKNKNRESDITLADFWGIQNVLPEMDDDKGTSLAVINSEKGKEIFEEIQEKIVWRKTDLEEAIKYNSSMVSSVAMPKNRERFMREITDENFDEIVKKYCSVGLITRIKLKIKRILKKLKGKIKL